MKRAAKQIKVEEMIKVFATNSAIMVINLERMTAAQLFSLRQKLWENAADIRVTKNNLVKIALKNQGLSFLESYFVGQTAVLYSNDLITLAKVAKELTKEWANKIKLLGGGHEQKVISPNEIQQLANMPPLPILQAQIIALIGIEPAKQLIKCFNITTVDILSILKIHSNNIN